MISCGGMSSLCSFQGLISISLISNNKKIVFLRLEISSNYLFQITAKSTMEYLKFMREFRYVPGETMFSEFQYPLGISFAYLAGVYLLSKIMKNREKIVFPRFNSFHNFFMTALSLIMFVGMLVGLIEIYFVSVICVTSLILKDLLQMKSDNEDFLSATLCDSKNTHVLKGTMYFWIYVFYLSKFIEVIDTFIIVLKKVRQLSRLLKFLFRQGKLIFLHVYHHWITMLLCFVCLDNALPMQWVACSLNCLVHVPMYYYYWISGRGGDVWWKKYITQMQIIQFCLVNVGQLTANYLHFYGNRDCQSFNPPTAHFFAAFVINSYLFLFILFYFEAYKKGPKRSNGHKKEN
jgi:hypothetical protein